MYQQKARGHGVCGSLNIYSNNVKLGNWVEDTIAAELIANPTEPYKNFSTNTSLSYLDPKDQPPPPTMNMPSTQELKAKNKEGMPYGLIFDHGMTPVTSEVIDRCSVPTYFVFHHAEQTCSYWAMSINVFHRID
jgi:hypothetical protein